MLLAPLLSLVLAGDPLPPPGGFDYRIHKDQDVTWSDGYQTQLDAYVPEGRVPAGGWPVALCLHGGGGSRKNIKIRPRCKALARAGYIAFAYDTRGNGDTVALNLGSGLPEYSADKLRDIAESFALVRQRIGPAKVDASRLAIAGISGGGHQTYAAASISGQPLPAPGPTITHMPTISAVAGQVYPLDLVEEFVPDGNRMQARAAKNRVQRGEPADEVAAILAEDFAGLRAILEADPVDHLLPNLRQCDVPILFIHTWDDSAHRIHSSVEAFATLNPAVNHRFVVSTGVHGTPENQIEREYMNETIRQWFDVHLKGRDPAPAHDDRVEVVVNPSDLNVYLNELEPWAHLPFASWPPSAATQTLYLRGSGNLTTNPPSTVESGPTVSHNVAAGYTVSDFFVDDADPALVVPAGIAHDAKVFATSPATGDMMIQGSPTVKVEVDSDSGTFQLHAALYDCTSTSRRYIAGGTTAVYDEFPGRHELRIEIQDMAYIVEAGHWLELQIENLALREPPGQSPFFNEVPYFIDSNVTIVIDPNQPPRLELPVAIRPGLTTPRINTTSVAATSTVQVDVDAGQARAGQYVFATWNMTADAFLNSVTEPQLQVLGSGGLLDFNGEASIRISIAPSMTSLAGTRWTFNLGGFDSMGPWRSGPSEVILWP